MHDASGKHVPMMGGESLNLKNHDLELQSTSRSLVWIASSGGGIEPALAPTRSWAVLPHLVDDFLVGASLLFAVWRCRKNLVAGRRYLAAAWGAACGMAYNSLAWQLMTLDQPDPAPISSLAVAAVKGAGLLLAAFALMGSLREPTAN